MPEWIELLAGPIQKGGFDFVAPLYSRYKYDGTITNTVTYPLTRSLYGLRIRQPIGGDFGVSGDLIAHYLEQDDWDADVSKFGVDIWMTTKAITGGFAVCQTRLGAKVHDPKDPGADLGPMFSQVVATLLRLTDEHHERWANVRGSHEVPAYGFERILDPPPLEVNTRRLLDEFAKGRRQRWRRVAGDTVAGKLRRSSQSFPTRPGAWSRTGCASPPRPRPRRSTRPSLPRRDVGARGLRHVHRVPRAPAAARAQSWPPSSRFTSAAWRA